MSDATRKRSRTSSSIDHASSSHASLVHNASLDMIRSNKKISLSPPESASASKLLHHENHTAQQLSFEVANLKTELSTLKSLRSMDQMKAETTEKRLKRYISSLEEDAKSSLAYAEEIQSQIEKALMEKDVARRAAVAEAREWQERFILLQEEGAIAGDENDFEGGEELQLVQKKNEYLQTQMQSKDEEINALRAKVSALASASNQNDDTSLNSSNHSHDKGIGGIAGSANIKSPHSKAPPAVLSELYRTRHKYDETERLNRQLKHKNNELQTKVEQLVVYREKAQRVDTKLEKLERELKMLRRERETHRLIEARWVEFRKELLNQNFPNAAVDGNHKNDDENIPPEIATVLRQFRFLSSKVEEMETEKHSNTTNLKSTQRRLQLSEEKVEDLVSQVQSSKAEISKLMEERHKTEQELKIIQAQERVWKRHNNSMVSLIGTYEEMEKKISPMKKKIENNADSQNTSGNQTSQALQLSLQAANDQIQLLKNQFTSMKEDHSNIEKEKEASKEELERVKTKFEKLREALYKEREKAEKAETRALEAETLCGKGSFNPETTRALHMVNNPTTIALREKYQKEIKELKEELQSIRSEADASSGKGSAKPKGQISELEAKKLHKRLKESFRAQIALFREGVYLLTGHKIDMVSEGDRPKFKVRSMFAEKESDVLEFIWPELEDGKPPVSLDMLSTKMGQELSQEPCFKYIERYGSLPAFMASVCLTLFERQTMI